MGSIMENHCNSLVDQIGYCTKRDAKYKKEQMQKNWDAEQERSRV
jgi:hypothetical protein